MKHKKGLNGVFKCTNKGELFMGEYIFTEGKPYLFQNGVVIDEQGELIDTECSTLVELNNTYFFQFTGGQKR